MRKLLLPILVMLLACSPENKPSYTIHVGESMELYLGTNSCCGNCWIDSAHVMHLRWVKEEVIETSDLAGGSGRMAWTFQGVSPGVDTLRIAWIQGGVPCAAYDSSFMRPTRNYVVEVLP